MAQNQLEIITSVKDLASPALKNIGQQGITAGKQVEQGMAGANKSVSNLGTTVGNLKGVFQNSSRALAGLSAGLQTASIAMGNTSKELQAVSSIMSGFAAGPIVGTVNAVAVGIGAWVSGLEAANAELDKMNQERLSKAQKDLAEIMALEERNIDAQIKLAALKQGMNEKDADALVAKRKENDEIKETLALIDQQKAKVAELRKQQEADARALAAIPQFNREQGFAADIEKRMSRRESEILDLRADTAKREAVLKLDDEHKQYLKDQAAAIKANKEATEKLTEATKKQTAVIQNGTIPGIENSDEVAWGGPDGVTPLQRLRSQSRVGLDEQALEVAKINARNLRLPGIQGAVNAKDMAERMEYDGGTRNDRTIEQVQEQILHYTLAILDADRNVTDEQRRHLKVQEEYLANLANGLPANLASWISMQREVTLEHEKQVALTNEQIKKLETQLDIENQIRLLLAKDSDERKKIQYELRREEMIERGISEEMIDRLEQAERIAEAQKDIVDLKKEELKATKEIKNEQGSNGNMPSGGFIDQTPGGRQRLSFDQPPGDGEIVDANGSKWIRRGAGWSKGQLGGKGRGTGWDTSGLKDPNHLRSSIFGGAILQGFGRWEGGGGDMDYDPLAPRKGQKKITLASLDAAISDKGQGMTQQSSAFAIASESTAAMNQAKEAAKALSDQIKGLKSGDKKSDNGISQSMDSFNANMGFADPRPSPKMSLQSFDASLGFESGGAAWDRNNPWKTKDTRPEWQKQAPPDDLEFGAIAAEAEAAKEAADKIAEELGSAGDALGELATGMDSAANAAEQIPPSIDGVTESVGGLVTTLGTIVPAMSGIVTAINTAVANLKKQIDDFQKLNGGK